MDNSRSFDDYLQLSGSPDRTKQPLLYVDINLGADSVERITVFEGDEAEVLAKEFA